MQLNKITIDANNVATVAPAQLVDLLSPTTVLNSDASLVRIGLYALILTIIR